MRCREWKTIVLMLCLMCSAFGCKVGQESEKEEYLMKSGEETVSTAEFQEAVKMNGSVYSMEELKDAELLEGLRLRALKELKEGLVLSRIAGEHEISVSDAELDIRVEEISKDYPEGTFEEVLLENVISLKSWKESLRDRMLKDKVVRICLEEKINVSPEDLKNYYNRIDGGQKSGADEQTSNETLLLRFRKEKAESLYGDWINGYLEKFPVEINAPVWERLSAGKQ